MKTIKPVCIKAVSGSFGGPATYQVRLAVRARSYRTLDIISTEVFVQVLRAKKEAQLRQNTWTEDSP